VVNNHAWRPSSSGIENSTSPGGFFDPGGAKSDARGALADHAVAPTASSSAIRTSQARTNAPEFSISKSRLSLTPIFRDMP
jgi:hypothetical protein